MLINRELLDKIAHLSRLEFNEQDADKMVDDMSTIVSWVEKLNEVDTTGVEPLTTMTYEINSFREDVPKVTLTREEALKNAPKANDEFFLVPKVLE